MLRLRRRPTFADPDQGAQAGSHDDTDGSLTRIHGPLVPDDWRTSRTSGTPGPVICELTNGSPSTSPRSTPQSGSMTRLIGPTAGRRVRICVDALGPGAEPRRTLPTGSSPKAAMACRRWRSTRSARRPIDRPRTAARSSGRGHRDDPAPARIPDRGEDSGGRQALPANSPEWLKASSSPVTSELRGRLHAPDQRRDRQGPLLHRQRRSHPSAMRGWRAATGTSPRA